MANNIVDGINRILIGHGAPTTIGLQDIVITKDTISDLPIDSQKLSRLVVDTIWPKLNEIEVFHFTNVKAAESIESAMAIRFTSITKNYGEAEIEAFCKAHALDGYLQFNKGEPRYRRYLMPDLFVLCSIACDDIHGSEDYCRKHFGLKRIRLRIQARNPNFRRVMYSHSRGGPIPLLAELSNLAAQNGRHFLFAGISRMCAFYLTQGYEIERECRALVKHWPGFGPAVQNDGGADFIEIPLGVPSDSGYTISLVDIK